MPWRIMEGGGADGGRGDSSAAMRSGMSAEIFRKDTRCQVLTWAGASPGRRPAAWQSRPPAAGVPAAAPERPVPARSGNRLEVQQGDLVHGLLRLACHVRVRRGG